MRYGLKERLIGALALIALAVIFLPFVLEEERLPAPVSDKIVTPPAPEPVEVEVARPEPPEVDDALTDEEKQTLSQQQTRSSSEPSSAMQLSPEGGVEAWAIQVASFSEAANAKRLVGRLQEQNYQPYWRKINNLAVVFVGPYIDQQQARNQQDQLLQELGMKTLLTDYVPENVARKEGSLPNLDD
ncbi:SPOR domain-containing protein [Marinospirillum sp.]|uniref:SPOR domain-containing protein n=1 Tax=Marinospirillum sp. TaxID=2183934 RepID=UPI003850D719